MKSSGGGGSCFCFSKGYRRVEFTYTLFTWPDLIVCHEKITPNYTLSFAFTILSMHCVLRTQMHRNWKIRKVHVKHISLVCFVGVNLLLYTNDVIVAKRYILSEHGLDKLDPCIWWSRKSPKINLKDFYHPTRQTVHAVWESKINKLQRSVYFTFMTTLHKHKNGNDLVWASACSNFNKRYIIMVCSTFILQHFCYSIIIV